MTGIFSSRRATKFSSTFGAVFALAAVFGLLTSPQDAVADWLPLEDIHEGMEGYGLTVFSGARIDTFGVKVLGVQNAAKVDGSLILVELSGHDLALAAVSRGMSGSPVYLEGRFAGAVAFGWPGALKPIAGLTPAREMMRIPEDIPSGAAASLPNPTSGRIGYATALLSEEMQDTGRRLRSELFEESGGLDPMLSHAGETWPEPMDLARQLLSDCLGRPIEEAGGGFLPTDFLYRPTGLAESPLSTTAASGTPIEKTTLRAGSACAVPLIMGAAQIGAIGTTTVVDGDRVLAMGHPLMQRGAVNLPLAAADIVTVFPSRDISFKMGSIGELVGAIHYDQRAGLGGRLGNSPKLIPVSVEVTTAGQVRRYDYEVVNDPQLTPSLVFWGIYNSLLAEADDAGRQSVLWELDSTWLRAGVREELHLEGHGGATGGVAALAPEWMAPLQILMQNRYQPVELEGVKARLSLQRPASEGLIATAVAPLQASPADSLEIEVTLEKRRGGNETVYSRLFLPRQLQPGRYRLVVASARDLFALEAERAGGRFADRSLEATLDLIRSSRSASQLVVALVSPGRGVLLDGRELAHLPGTVERVLGKNTSGRVAPTLADFVGMQRMDTDMVLRGFVIREIEIVSPVNPVREVIRK